MNSLGFLLFFLVTVVWVWPRSLGRFIAKVEEGYRAAKEGR